MADKLKEEEREVGELVKELVEGITGELKGLIPHIDLSPEIPDSKIKQAILELSPQGMENLFRQFGREAVMNFIGQFSEGRRF